MDIEGKPAEYLHGKIHALEAMVAVLVRMTPPESLGSTTRLGNSVSTFTEYARMLDKIAQGEWPAVEALDDDAIVEFLVRYPFAR